METSRADLSPKSLPQPSLGDNERPGEQSQRWAHLSRVPLSMAAAMGGKDEQANPVAAPRRRRSPWPIDWLVTCPRGFCPSALCHSLHPTRIQEFKREWTCIPALWGLHTWPVLEENGWGVPSSSEWMLKGLPWWSSG